MVFCCLPRAIEQLHPAEILYCEATPVIRSTGGLETAFAVASVLVAQHLKPSMFIPAQQVRAEQPSASPVEYGDRSQVNDRGPYLGHELAPGRGRKPTSISEYRSAGSGGQPDAVTSTLIG